MTRKHIRWFTKDWPSIECLTSLVVQWCCWRRGKLRWNLCTERQSTTIQVIVLVAVRSNIVVWVLFTVWSEPQKINFLAKWIGIYHLHKRFANTYIYIIQWIDERSRSKSKVPASMLDEEGYVHFNAYYSEARTAAGALLNSMHLNWKD